VTLGAAVVSMYRNGAIGWGGVSLYWSFWKTGRP
jgi:hypothetical protein